MADLTLTATPIDVGTALSGINVIAAAPITISVVPSGVKVIAETGPIVLSFTQKESTLQRQQGNRNPLLDQTFYCDQYSAIPTLTIGLSGDWPNQTVFANAITIGITPSGIWPESIAVSCPPIIIGVSLQAPYYGEAINSNQVAWSKIGYFDFTIDDTNLAGARPMDWKGWVNDILKLGNKVVVYGEGGVSYLVPAGNAWGLNTIYRVGTKNKGAVAGNDFIHFFIDAKDQLWQLTDTLEFLNYQEYLSNLGRPILSWDEGNYLLYMCDGYTGYVYNPRDRSFGEGPPNVTGIGYKEGAQYIAGSENVIVPPFEMTTDITDLGTRKLKTILSLEFGTDLTGPLLAAIDYRFGTNDSFSSTRWHTTNDSGIALFGCRGREFRIKAKVSTYEYFELDYINVNGIGMGH